MYAIIDVGSNTVRLNIYRQEYGQLTQVLNRKESVGLSSYIKNGYLMPSGIRRVTSVLRDFKSLLDDLEIQDIHAFATAALRNARNSEEAAKEISKGSGLKVQVISGETEAELDFLGVFGPVHNASNGLLVDIGGGSTELIIYKEGEMSHMIDLPFGSLNTYDSFVENILPTKKERKAIKAAILNELEKLPDDFDKGPYPVILGIGGTARAMNKLAIDMFRLPAESSSVKTSALGKAIKLMENNKEGAVPVDALDILVRVVPFRIRTLLPGMIIFHTIAKYFGCESIEVIESGVREGFLYKYVLGPSTKESAQKTAKRTRKTTTAKNKKTASSAAKAGKTNTRSRRTKKAEQPQTENPSNETASQENTEA